ncbi:putative signal transducing protein [Nannocystaceae bacterium ST9]
MADELVSLCECWDLIEAQTIRASLESRGVFVHVDGEHHRSMLGMMGSAVALRIMVRSSQLDLARELAAEIIPSLARDDDEDDDEPAGAEHSPLRRPPAADLLAYRDEDDDVAREHDEDDDGPAPPAKKSIAVALVVLGLGLAVGLIHLYAEQRSQGIGLLVVGIVAFVAMIGGQAWGFPVLASVWVIDATHGIWLLRERNREIDERSKPKPLLN